MKYKKSRTAKIGSGFGWSQKRESNPYARLGRRILSPLRLPVPSFWDHIRKRETAQCFPSFVSGAGDESRTRDLNLGKVALYQLSYSRVNSFGGARRNRTAVNGFAIRCMATLLSRRQWSGRRVSNSRPQPWQGCALPTELLPHFQRRMRIIRSYGILSSKRRYSRTVE